MNPLRAIDKHDYLSLSFPRKRESLTLFHMALPMALPMDSRFRGYDRDGCLSFAFKGGL